MKNINLNAGGVIGALVAGGIAAAVILPTVDPNNAGRGPFRLVILALVGGAFVGTFLWSMVFKKPE